MKIQAKVRTHMNQHSPSQAGFTLLELIVVIVSLGIVAAIIFFISQ